MNADYADLTPPQVDTILANATEKRAAAEAKFGHALDELHRLVGDTREGGRFGRGPWQMDTDALVGAIEAALTGSPESYTRRLIHDARTECDRARGERSLWTGVINDCQTEWLRRDRWSRFFLVKANNGHIHSGMDCSTCFVTTQFGWLPQLSGLTEADAVADQGEILCSVCFPTAPSAWTSGISRADKEARAERDAAKAARAAKKAAKALLPDGAPLLVDTGRTRPEAIETLHAAKAWLTDEAEWNRGGAHPSFPTAAKLQIAEAVAAKTGDTVEAVLAAAKARAEKRSR